MATKYLATSPKYRATDQNGVPLNGGFVYTFAAGTTTPIATYSNGSGTVNANPIVLDSRGECSLWLTAGLKYDLRVTDSVGVLQYTAERVSGLVEPSSYVYTLMDETTQTAVFNTIVAPGGTITAALNMEDAAFNFPARITVASATSTPIGAAASNSITISTVAPSITWTARTSAADLLWVGVAWSPSLSLFAAVAADGTGSQIMTSPDGVTWTIRSHSGSSRAFTGICWSADLGIFCAVANNDGGLGASLQVITSTDGITWTNRTASANNDWARVCWASSANLFCAVAYDGASRVMTSPDGVTWTSRTAAAANQWRSVCWSPELGLFAAVAQTGASNRVMTSPDGITWTSRTSAEDNTWYDITWSSDLGIFCAVSADGVTRVMTSSDGITWTGRTAAAANQWLSVIWVAEWALFVAVANTGTDRCMTSPDGITWTANATPNTNNYSSVAYAPSLALAAAVAQSGTGNRVMTGTI